MVVPGTNWVTVSSAALAVRSQGDYPRSPERLLPMLDRPRTNMLLVRRFLLAALFSAAGCAQGSAPRFPETGALDPEVGAAVAEVRAELEKTPRDASTWIKAGMTFEGNDLLAQARDCYGNALGLAETPQGWYRRSVVAGKLGDLPEAVASIRRALELVPDYAPSHWRLGGYLFDQGDFDGARKAFQRATELDAQFVGAWGGLVRVHLTRGETKEALALLESLRTRFPNHAHIANLLRTALVQAGRGEEAGRVAAGPNSSASPGTDPWQNEFWRFVGKPLMVRARQALEGGNAKEAVELLESSSEGPADPNASAYLAWGYYLLGRWADARATLDKALALDADNVVVLSMQARIQERSQEYAKALATCERIAAVDPRNGANLGQAGRLNALLGRPEEALKALRAALDLDGRDPELWAELGVVLVQREQWQDAVAPLERALNAGAKKMGTRTALAWAYVETGRTAEARALLERSGTLTPEEQSLLARVKKQ
jgi:superkiller protein 3